MKKIIRYLFVSLLALVIILCLALLILPRFEGVQAYIGKRVEVALAEKLKTRVEVGSVNIGLPIRAVIDDVVVYDQKNKKMLKSKRISAGFQLITFLKSGKIIFTNAELLALDANICRDNDNKYNFQFIVDAFASKDTTHTPLNLQITRLRLQDCSLNWLDIDKDASVRNLMSNIELCYLTDDSLQVQIKELSCTASSRYYKLKDKEIRKLKASFKRNINEVHLTDVSLQLPITDININKVVYDVKSEKLDFNIEKSKISTEDFIDICPGLDGLGKIITLQTSGSWNGGNLMLDELNLATDDKDLILNMRGDYVEKLSVQKSLTAEVLNRFVNGDLNIVKRLGDIDYVGRLAYDGDEVDASGRLSTDIGNMIVFAKVTQDKVVDLKLDTKDLNVGKILDNNNLGIVASNIEAQLDLSTTPLNLNIDLNVLEAIVRGYKYKNVKLKGCCVNNLIDANISSNDENCRFKGDIKMLIAQCPKLKLNLDIEKVSPTTLHLIDRFKNSDFSAKISADVSGEKLDNINGVICINDLQMSSPEKSVDISNLTISSSFNNGQRELSVSSDFLNADIKGKFSLSNFGNDIVYAIKSRLPSIPGLPDAKPTSNKYSFDFCLTDTKTLNKFIDLPIEILKPLNINGNVDELAHKINVDIFMPEFRCNGSDYIDGEASISTPGDSMICKVFFSKLEKNRGHYNVTINSTAIDNKLHTDFSWFNPLSGIFNGKLNTEAHFFQDMTGKAAAHLDILPSEIVFNDAIWMMEKSSLEWADKKLTVNGVALCHADQFIAINGVASDSFNDSISVDLKDVNVQNIINAVDFTAVDFSGYATGKASIVSVFNNPKAYANLLVNQFEFEHGNLGVLDACVNWNNSEKQIEISAETIDDIGGKVLIDGYVSPSKNFINLALLPKNANLEFLQSFIGGVMDNTHGRGTGHLKLVGPLSTIQLVGAVSANAKCHVHVLNTDYEVRGDSIYFVPDDILLKNVKVYDKYDNVAVANGGIHHKHLTRLTFDLDFKTDRLLAFDTKDFDGNMFYGTVFAQGNVTMSGISGQVRINGSVSTLKGSSFTYNAAIRTYLNTQKFITFRDKSELQRKNLQADALALTFDKREDREEKSREVSTNLYCDFDINTTTDGQIRILMDSKSNDYITLYGNGNLKASYYNKGKFGLYGTYTVDHGSYGLSIQNVIQKKFLFNQGGTITFVGEPYDAMLNLQAYYLVSGVSLADLSIGNSFTSNTIRVNCLMNIAGTPNSPKVNFDIDMPSLNSDEQQMVRTLINSEEDMNQQVMCLLGIGRFYSKTNNNVSQVDGSRSQTSLAMQSVLSGTISSQINNMLGLVVRDDDWNFGANITTGTEGWNNAEYEGTVSGRMFNNRLLFNGQFGYRDNVKTATTSFIGDFELQYLLLPNGNLSVKAYNQANERYFTKSSLNTQGIGLLMKKDFRNLRDLFTRKRKNK